MDEQEANTLDPAHAVPLSTWASRMRGKAPARWFFYYLLEFFWILTTSPLTLLYVLSGAAIVGFVSLWFGFNYEVLGDYIRSFVHDDALMGIGFLITTFAVPLICDILIVARNNAIITADIGNRVYSAQFLAMRNLHIPGRAYLSAAILLNMLVGSLLLLGLATAVAVWSAFQTWQLLFPDQPFELWSTHFFRIFVRDPALLWEHSGWVLLKTSIGILLASLIAIREGFRPKGSVIDINHAIARSIVHGISIILLAHAGIAILQY